MSEVYGGRGAYTSGIVKFRTTKKLYLYIGGQGGKPSSCNTNAYALGGYNGGGNGGRDTNDDDSSGGGGGATDIRLINGTGLTSLASRIMVAAGGSGAVFGCYGAPGGNLTGYITTSYGEMQFSASNTTQTAGYSLGIGANGKPHVNTPGSGAGGGYYGGFGDRSELYKDHTTEYFAVASSGSSYVSGYDGCNSVDENGNHTNSSKHSSGIVFTQPQILDGNSEFRNPDFLTEVGHTGNGAVRITPIESEQCYNNVHTIFCPSMNLYSSIFSLSFLLISQ